MQCAECSYQLSPFDKECPRCKNLSMKGLKQGRFEPVELTFDDESQRIKPVLETIPVAIVEGAKAKCTNCSYSLETGWQVCPRCGANLGQAVLPTTPEMGRLTPNTEPMPQTVIEPPATLTLIPTTANSSTQTARVLVAVILLFIGVPGMIGSATMALSSPESDAVAIQKAGNKASGTTSDPIEYKAKEENAVEGDAANHTVGGVLFLFSSALCIPGVLLLSSHA